MRILVTGSRDWEDGDAIWDALSDQYECWEHADCDHTYTVVSGACPTGADKLAEDAAFLRGWTVECHPAEWDRYGKRAGFLRNQEMVDLGADVCLAFIKNGSKGASMTARLAERAGIPVKRYVVDDLQDGDAE